MTLDFLVAKTSFEFNNKTLKRVLDELPDENTYFVLNLIDNALRDLKVKKADASYLQRTGDITCVDLQFHKLLP